MTKIKGPLFSNKASGSLGPRLTYQKRASGPQIRHQKAQKDITTAARTTERGYFIDGAVAWQTLNANEQAQWDAFNKG